MKKKDFVIFLLDVMVVEDVFDELEFLGFMVSYLFFELLRMEFWGVVLVKDFL